MKNQIRTGVVVGVGLISIGGVLVCVGSPIAMPLGFKLGISVVGILGTVMSAGYAALQHWDDKKEETKANEEIDNSSELEQLKHRLAILEERCVKNKSDMQSINQKLEEVEIHQNTIEIQLEMIKKEQNAKISLALSNIDSLQRRISAIERRITSHVNKEPKASSSTTSSPSQTTHEQIDTIPENVNILLSRHGIHSSNQSEDSQPSDASSARKRRTPANLRI
ncbi:MAG: hypothetical protein P4L79_02345 [Legionella sp.]|uniref:hypothetical protein n=1 Tax=Legionella sp. TaxID=459 RepID=UPI002849C763|nr:hypothetical protein [Legionella sp.]